MSGTGDVVAFHVIKGDPAVTCQRGMRCDACKKAQREDVARRIKWRQRLLAENPTLREHGRSDTYNLWGCRCTECRTAASTLRRTQSRGTKKRIRTEAFGREWLTNGT